MLLLKHIGKEFAVVYQNNEDYSFISKLLKLDGHVLEEKEGDFYTVSYHNYSLKLFDEKEITLEDQLKNEKEIDISLLLVDKPYYKSVQNITRIFVGNDHTFLEDKS